MCVLFTVYAEVQVKPTKCLVKTGQSLDIDCVVTTSTDWPVWLNQSSTEPRASHVCSPDGRVRQGLQYKFSVEKTDSHTYRLRIKDVQLSDEGWFYCQETAEIRNLANTTVTVTGRLRYGNQSSLVRLPLICIIT